MWYLYIVGNGSALAEPLSSEKKRGFDDRKSTREISVAEVAFEIPWLIVKSLG